MPRPFGSVGILALAAVLAGPVQAQEKTAIKAPSGQDATVTGTVVDVSCKFGQGLSGPDHRMAMQIGSIKKA